DLLAYVKQGGRLLVTGAHSAGFFRDDVEFGSDADSVASLGKGKIGMIGEDIGTEYFKNPTDEMRERLGRKVDELFPKQIVTVTGSHALDVTLNRAGKKTVVNLLNIGRGPDVGAAGVYNEIPPLTDIHVTYRTQKKPSKITLIPGNKKLTIVYESGEASVVIPRIDIHSLLVIE
ncbi:MAG TPA: hypothetical protein VK470_02585, partial [Bacteroidota bacterium]|nr:hypothetical protein [Bacteroidota bacterium]